MYMPVDINLTNQYFRSVHLMYYSRMNVKHGIQQQKVALRVHCSSPCISTYEFPRTPTITQ